MKGDIRCNKRIITPRNKNHYTQRINTPIIRIFRLNIIKRSNDEKLNIFKDILKIVYELHEYDFYSIDELIAFDNYDN